MKFKMQIGYPCPSLDQVWGCCAFYREGKCKSSWQAVDERNSSV